MGNAVFGKPRPPAPVVPEITLDQQIRNLEKRRVYLEGLAKVEEDQAKKAMAEGNKDSAMRHLTMKKRHVDGIQTTYAMLAKLEAIRVAKEQASLQRDTLLVTKHVANQIQTGAMDAEKAEDILEGAQEALDKVDDVSRLFAPPPPDADLEAELEALGKPDVVVPMPEVPMPNPPTAMERELALAM